MAWMVPPVYSLGCQPVPPRQNSLPADPSLMPSHVSPSVSLSQRPQLRPLSYMPMYTVSFPTMGRGAGIVYTPGVWNAFRAT